MRATINKKTIPRKTSFVNVTVISVGERLEKLGVTKARANQAPDIFAETAESALRNACKFLFTN